MQDPPSIIQTSKVDPFFDWPTQRNPQRGVKRYLHFVEALLRTYKAPKLLGVHQKIAERFMRTHFGTWVSEDKTRQSVLNLINQVSAEQPPLRLPDRAAAEDKMKSIVHQRRSYVCEALKQYVQKFSEILDCFVSQKDLEKPHAVFASAPVENQIVYTHSLRMAKLALDQTETLAVMNLNAKDRLWYATDRESPGILQKTGTASYIRSYMPLKSLGQDPYKTAARLIKHLRRKHFPERNDVEFSLWMNVDNRWAAEETVRSLSYLLTIATGTLERAHLNLLHLKHGVFTFTEAIHIAADTIRTEITEGGNGNRRDQNVRAMSHAFLAVIQFGRCLLEAIKTARHKLYAMTRGPDGSNLYESPTYGPNVVLGCIAQTLYQRALLKDAGAVRVAGASSIYRLAFDRIKLEANRHPNKKIFLQIARLQEELTALSRVNQWQWNAVNKLRMLSDDDTFYKSDLRRKREHLRIRWMTNRTTSWLDLESKEYHEMLRMCLPLAERTKQGVEIYEEDHGKLLFVFTVVTVVFLPLSFITGYFGMNTVDIRNTTWGQDRYWAIAIPVTMVVVAFTWVTASLGDTWTRLLADFSNGDRVELEREPTPDDKTIVLEEAEFRARNQAKAPEPQTQGAVALTTAPTTAAPLTQPSLVRREDWEQTFLPVGESHGSYLEAFDFRNYPLSGPVGTSGFDPLTALVPREEAREELPRIPDAAGE
ncbi:hypothetical protein EDB81DRAFT_915513 [Dactylonectria macrodidyma]|uniref:Uncharacterized protein n=1 Tax=Dactylonectria macrodidyma TaxID=307937 RepID=A0A9P9DFU6_9HYPO|nr:hypothetical protein EDB81DRAFT_915513 [Dactylonectria macrodidyma]